MDRITKFLILLVAALVLVPGCFAEKTNTTDAVNTTVENVSVVGNISVEANNTTIDASMNLTNVSPFAATEGANTSAVKGTTL
jgi:hypothetical protein